MTLRPHDTVPYFEIADIDGRTLAYRDLWQRRNLALIVLSESPTEAERTYLAALRKHWPELSAHDTAVVVTRAAIDGVPRPGVVVADRWGEIHWITAPPSVEQLPPAEELIEWLRYVQMQCPECQGETR